MHIRKYVIRVCDQDKFLGKRCDGGYLITSNIQKAIWFNNIREARQFGLITLVKLTRLF